MTPTNHNFLVAFCLMRDEAAVSYSWVLQGLRDIFGTAQTPSVIVTDRDEGLSAAIRDVFPDVRHLLCIWHIGNDVENMVDKLCGGKKNQQGQVFRKSRWNPLVESSTIEEYEDKWQVIAKLGGEEAWLLLRRAMSMEMQMNRAQYLTLYLSQVSLDESIFRIGKHRA
ncbi:protein FAR1-RELATED SEQUENCE 2-like [Amaranthus tricolor]|uniref:protein FAR1-RELATED SEQUENCE 2-like n=1 Tax=Amaranthus tricolor TaxID=29722 RepID=UPI002585F406|nr:protein FAR1-RELATED SEQUENCE 2-like [Amaranthus tricolor]